MNNTTHERLYKFIIEAKVKYGNDLVLRRLGRQYIFDICKGDMKKIKKYLKTNCNNEEEIAFEYDLYLDIKNIMK